MTLTIKLIVTEVPTCALLFGAWWGIKDDPKKEKKPKCD